jgi:hypothetical protein
MCLAGAGEAVEVGCAGVLVAAKSVCGTAAGQLAARGTRAFTTQMTVFWQENFYLENYNVSRRKDCFKRKKRPQNDSASRILG